MEKYSKLLELLLETSSNSEAIERFYSSPIVQIYKNGGIHIKKKNRGKFTASAKRAGMSVQEFARHVLANKDKYSTTQIHRANFARNSKK